MNPKPSIDTLINALVMLCGVSARVTCYSRAVCKGLTRLRGLKFVQLTEECILLMHWWARFTPGL